MIIHGLEAENHASKVRTSESINAYVLAVNDKSSLARALNIELEINPYSSRLITVAIFGILVLFFSGVIYPLSFMPMSLAGTPVLQLSAVWGILFSLRGAILFVLSAIFTVMMLSLLVLNLRLKFDKCDIETLKHFSEPMNYSIYL